MILGDYLYWTDWKTESIHKANKNNGNNSEVVLKGREGLMDIRLVQVKKVKENACGNDNGGCSHLCLRKPNGFSCACPTGLLLQVRAALLQAVVGSVAKYRRHSREPTPIFLTERHQDVQQPA